MAGWATQVVVRALFPLRRPSRHRCGLTAPTPCALTAGISRGSPGQPGIPGSEVDGSFHASRSPVAGPSLQIPCQLLSPNPSPAALSKSLASCSRQLSNALARSFDVDRRPVNTSFKPFSQAVQACAPTGKRRYSRQCRTRRTKPPLQRTEEPRSPSYENHEISQPEASRAGEEANTVPRARKTSLARLAANEHSRNGVARTPGVFLRWAKRVGRADTAWPQSTAAISSSQEHVHDVCSRFGGQRRRFRKSTKPSTLRARNRQPAAAAQPRGGCLEEQPWKLWTKMCGAAYPHLTTSVHLRDERDPLRDDLERSKNRSKRDFIALAIRVQWAATEPDSSRPVRPN
ncbi:hypothetical protein V8D89_015406 [Ganoderma adspersum]